MKTEDDDIKEIYAEIAKEFNISEKAVALLIHHYWKTVAKLIRDTNKDEKVDIDLPIIGKFKTKNSAKYYKPRTKEKIYDIV